jgi:hypothetical protein
MTEKGIFWHKATEVVIVLDLVENIHKVLGATQSLLIYCFLRSVRKKGQW